ncbi:hypothetical protein BGZ97_005129 [Linnemannia gamsii]|jgi:GNAT superfamily N-acetyltransferase|uniref:N-acetyltransferase domain-containing protein n=1 Tax=Linnemannia gamsii TaxID=64522 RepID=A0A9P6RHT3_9FUNG|nr:hypothetical protein BGZ97_005129 [Linnemannia gamsii]
MIDKAAIRIRPYQEADRDQVLETLFLGFSMVGDRIVQKTIRHRSTVLGILAKSLLYTLLLELAIVTLSAINNSQGSGTGGVVEDFKALQEALMEPTTIQGMVSQFLKPSFMLLAAGMTVLVTLATVYSIYSNNEKETEKYIQGCLDEDLGDIVAYYQKDVPSSPPSAATIDSKEIETSRNRKTKSATTPKKNRSQFWVACLESHPQLVLGCISLDDVAAHADSLLTKHLKQGSPESTFTEPSEFDAELRRLSVHPNYRRLGVAKLLMQTLKDSAKKQGFKRVILSTTFHQPEAIAGYIRFGFEREKLVRISEFFTLWFAELKLNATAKEIEAQKEQQAAFLREVGLDSEKKIV